PDFIESACCLGPGYSGQARRSLESAIFANEALQTSGTGARLFAHFCVSIWTTGFRKQRRWQADKDIVMAVKIRMKRVGAKNAPVFRIVVADSRSPRDGKFIEEIGTYQPLKKGDNFTMDLDRAKYWLSKGAQPSDTVASFIKKATKAGAATAAAA